jgi:inhibitor of KinA
LVTFRPFGDAAVLGVFGTEIDRTLSRQVFWLYTQVIARGIAGVTACIPAFTTLLVQFDPEQTDGGEVTQELTELCAAMGEFASEPGTRWRIPVCYGPDLAPDLEEVCRTLNLSVAEFARLHSAPAYLVYMLGGFPGYPYLGDVPERLRVPRRTSPRLRVEPGSVALAGRLSAIYPMRTPGGWNLVGRTPVPVFDLTADNPALLSPGDEVVFVPIPEIDYQEAATALLAGRIGRADLLARAP